MTDTHQWMTYPPTGGTNRFPLEAVDDWAVRGWEPCEAPPEPDPTNTVLVDGVEPDPTGEPNVAEDITTDAAGSAGDTNPDADNAGDTEEALTHG
jgi:hypothetical protein